MSRSPHVSALSPKARDALQAAFAMLEQGQVEDAATVWSRVSADFPDEPEVAYLEAELSMAAGDAVSADQALAKARSTAPDSLILAIRHADVLERLKRRTDALQTAAVARALADGSPAALWSLGRIHIRCGDVPTARELYEEAATALDRPALTYDVASARFFSHDLAGAEAALNELLGRFPYVGQAAYLRSVVRTQNGVHNHLDGLQNALSTAELDDTNRAALLYALAKELEDLGRHTEAFDKLAEGARLKRGTLDYDAVRERENIRQIGTLVTAEMLAGIDSGNAGDGALFIVGMPRTGTTLLEYQLGRHAGIPSAGELTDFPDILRAFIQRRMEAGSAASLTEALHGLDLKELGNTYMRTARQAAGGTDVFIDKMPANFMYCGLIARALPKAKILHMVRSPMDTCYSAFKTLFGDAYLYSYDQEELAEYFLAYRDLMAHWRSVVPDSILDVHYEDLVGDPERETRRVVEWCGLAWRSDAPHEPRPASRSASFAQARAPVHTGSVGLWQLHADRLEPIRRRLAGAGVAVD